MTGQEEGRGPGIDPASYRRRAAVAPGWPGRAGLPRAFLLACLCGLVLGVHGCGEGSAGPNPDPPGSEDIQLFRADPAPVGGVTRLYGRGFSRLPARNLVRFTNVDSSKPPVPANEVLDIGNEQVLEVEVPDGTLTGPVTVRVDGVESNPVPFILIIRVGYAPYEVRFLPSPQGHLRALCASLGDPTLQEGDDSSLSIRTRNGILE